MKIKTRFILTTYRTKKLVESIRSCLKEKEKEKIKEILQRLHPSEIATILDRLSDKELSKVFEILDKDIASAVLTKLDTTKQIFLMKSLRKSRILDLLSLLYADDVADLLNKLPIEEARDLVNRMHPQRAVDIGKLLRYPVESAGGLMTTEYISVQENLTVKETINMVHKLASTAKTIYYIYVIDKHHHLVGVLSLRELIMAPKRALIKKIMKTNVINVEIDMDQEEVAKVIARYDLLAIPVVDKEQKLLGIITADDIIDVIGKEVAEDIHRMSGIITEDVEIDRLIGASVFKVVRARLPWLLICLIGGLTAGFVVGSYEKMLQVIVSLSFFIPIIMDMGGNVGIQSSTVVVRGIATGQIGLHNMWKIILKEILIGLSLGIISGTIVGAVATLWQGLPELGIVVGLSMFLTLTVATTIGALLPLIFKLLNIDPALTSGPFVTTIKDVVALLIYFGLAIILMGHLI
jgi:magnesium transporter